MAIVTTELRDQIKTIVCDILEIDEGDVTESSLFNEDHGADSMRAIEILATLELNVGVSIDQAELPRMVNLAGIYEVVAEAAASS